MSPHAQTRQINEAEYIGRLIGLPWDAHVHHCWWLVCKIQKDLFDLSIPGLLRLPDDKYKKDRLIKDNYESTGFREVQEPIHGCVVLAGKGGSCISRSTYLEHAGVYFNFSGFGAVIVHTDQGHGVVADSTVEFQTYRGWNPFYFVTDIHMHMHMHARTQGYV